MRILIYLGGDKVQGTLLQKMAPRYIEYLNLEDFEKWQVQKGLSNFPLRQDSRPLYPGKKHLYFKIKGHREK